MGDYLAKWAGVENTSVILPGVLDLYEGRNIESADTESNGCNQRLEGNKKHRIVNLDKKEDGWEREWPKKTTWKYSRLKWEECQMRSTEEDQMNVGCHLSWHQPQFPNFANFWTNILLNHDSHLLNHDYHPASRWFAPNEGGHEEEEEVVQDAVPPCDNVIHVIFILYLPMSF